MELLSWSRKDPSERGPAKLSSNGRSVKLLRRILGLGDPLPDKSDALRRPSIAERLDEIFAHDRTRLNEVLPREIETISFLGLERIQAPVHAELDAVTEDSLSNELSPRNPAENGQVLQTATVDAKESPRIAAAAMTVDSMDLATKEAATQLQEPPVEMGVSLKSYAEDCEKQLAELSSAIEGVSGTLQVLQQKVMIDVADELEKAAKDLLNRSASQLQGQADATLAALGEELRASKQGVIEETKKQLATMTQASVESLANATREECQSQAAQIFQEQAQTARRDANAAVNSVDLATKEAVAQLQMARQEIEASLKGQAGGYQKRLAELLSFIEELQRRWNVLLEGQLQSNLQRFRQRATKDVADELQRTAKDLLNHAAQQLQEQADATLAALGEELQASKQGFIEETKKQLASMTQASVESLANATTKECRSQLSQMLQEFLTKGLRELEAEHTEVLRNQREAIQKQFDDFSKARLQENRWEFTRVERAPKHRVGGLRAGFKVALGLVATTLILPGIYVVSRPPTPTARLRAEPPAGFFDERQDWSAKRRAREEQLARAYWERAVRDVQAKYKFGTNLPDEPPAEFRVEEKGLSGSSPKVDPIARARYWGKLRQFWVLPEAWEKSSGWNMDWIRSALQSAYSRAKQGIAGPDTSKSPASP